MSYNRFTKPKCISCGADIKWIKTVSGRAMPCDPEPVRFLADKDNAEETFVMANGAVVRGRRAPDEYPFTYTGYISHFATCPYAKQHRRAK